MVLQKPLIIQSLQWLFVIKYLIKEKQHYSSKFQKFYNLIGLLSMKFKWIRYNFFKKNTGKKPDVRYKFSIFVSILRFFIDIYRYRRLEPVISIFYRKNNRYRRGSIHNPDFFFFLKQIGTFSLLWIWYFSFSFLWAPYLHFLKWQLLLE